MKPRKLSEHLEMRRFEMKDNNNSKKSLVDIWGDNVALKDLGIAALLCGLVFV